MSFREGTKTEALRLKKIGEVEKELVELGAFDQAILFTPGQLGVGLSLNYECEEFHSLALAKATDPIPLQKTVSLCR